MLAKSYYSRNSWLLRWLHTAGSISVVSLSCEPIPVCDWTKDPWKQQGLAYWTFLPLFGNHYILFCLLFCIVIYSYLNPACWRLVFPVLSAYLYPQQKHCKSPFFPVICIESYERCGCKDKSAICWLCAWKQSEILAD